jgi:circadian clock protein KaiB
MEYFFTLYVEGEKRISDGFLEKLKSNLDKLVKKYKLEIVDVRKNPDIANKKNVLATPMLEKTSPEPSCRLIGDLTKEKTLLRCIGKG